MIKFIRAIDPADGEDTLFMVDEHSNKVYCLLWSPERAHPTEQAELARDIKDGLFGPDPRSGDEVLSMLAAL
jgi:hypothetical protein